jgi:uncharacterized membrane protein
MYRPLLKHGMMAVTVGCFIMSLFSWPLTDFYKGQKKTVKGNLKNDKNRLLELRL